VDSTSTCLLSPFLILFSLPRFLLALPPFIRLISAMPPKGGNAKKEGGRAKKAENEVCRPHEILSLESLTRKGRRRKLKPRPKGEQRGKLKNGRMEVSRGVQDHADELAKGSSKTEAAAARAAEAGASTVPM
jgi:hypothetical protein